MGVRPNSLPTRHLCDSPDAMSASHPKVHPHRILECLINRRFGVEYQPFICTVTGNIVCYEALARFFDFHETPIAPDYVFESLHDNPLLLLHAELEMKRLQLAEAPPNGLLFVNLDPDSFAAGTTEDGGNVFLPLFSEQRSRLVIELIENLHLQDVQRSAQMVEALEAAKLRIAIDDLSSSRGLISYASLMNASFVKFDRAWLSGELNARQRTILTWALSQAEDLGLTTVLEGVENEAHLSMARQMGFDLVQGYLFGDRFIRRNPPRETAARRPANNEILLASPKVAH